MCSTWATVGWNASLLTAPGSPTPAHRCLGPGRQGQPQPASIVRAAGPDPPSMLGRYVVNVASYAVGPPAAQGRLFRPGSRRAATAASPATGGNIREIRRRQPELRRGVILGERD